MKVLPIVLASLFVPMAAQAECTPGNLQGRWVAMIAGEHGLWQRCDLRIASTGRATGSCLLSDGTVAATQPMQLGVALILRPQWTVRLGNSTTFSGISTVRW